ncbi:MAG: exopolysaccharide biosynthesis polyprenyl glycosylphosphotransferase [Candidatus Omnitrophica bacterium]|nr:exopolysaccharide biosynthesis polyprenyl glycosylphosphotransferase [Candidatus Omnitrophota bacterium]
MTRKKRQLETAKRILAGLFIITFGICVVSAWAALAAGPVSVPEPTSMVLFGGGLIGMVMSFLRQTYSLTKRIFDITASLLGAAILSPLLILTAVLVKLTSKGPIIYSQTRVGKDGQNFQIYKFRTMNVDAEKNTGPVWAAKNDNRLTPIGKFLRHAHIDELPQLFNVFRGEMSVIGPRPERPKFVTELKQIIRNYENRLSVKPGITGLAQVWHRYDESIEDVKKKLKYDLLYIRKMCLLADLNIILRTVRVVITGEGAR